MDVNAESMLEDFSQSSSSAWFRVSGNAALDPYSHLPVCGLCNRHLTLDNGDGDSQVIRFCGDCNFVISGDPILRHLSASQRSSILHHVRASQRSSRRRRRRRRYRSSESNFFPLQVSHVTHAAHFERDTQSMDGDSATTPLAFQHLSTQTTPNQSRRRRAVLSDSESDVFDSPSSQSRRRRQVVSDSESDVFDSLYGDSESNISFSGSRIFAGESDTISYSAYGGESDASVDRHSFLENEFYLGTFRDPETDTDIDPMNAGQYHWDSDEEDQEDTEWEEIDAEENRAASLVLGGQLDSNFNSSDINTTALQRLFLSRQSGDMVYTTAEQGTHRSLAISFANVEQTERQALAEMEISRIWRLPTATSLINNLPELVIQEDHENLDNLACAICKDSVSVGTIVRQLPCLHIYHPPCILPWLSIRSSCPLCRFELPRDARITNHNRLDFRGLDNVRESGRRRWPSLASALPILGIVGIALGYCIRRYNNVDGMVQRSSLRSIDRNTARSQRWFPF